MLCEHDTFKGRVIEIRNGEKEKKNRRYRFSDGAIEDFSIRQLQKIKKSFYVYPQTKEP